MKVGRKIGCPKKPIAMSGGGRPGKKKSKSRVNEAGNYTKPAMRKRIFNRIKAEEFKSNKGACLIASI